MNFNSDPKKQAQEVIFSWKSKAIFHPPLVFNNNIILTTFQNHLGIILDTRLSFKKHLETVLCKINKTIGLSCRIFYPEQLWSHCIKLLLVPHLDYGDIIYDQAQNASFHQKLESLQYNACLAITGAIRGSSREKIYQELGFESLQQRLWYRKLCSSYKVFKNESQLYLFSIIPISNPADSTRNHGNIPPFKTNDNFCKNTFFVIFELSNGIISTLIWETQILM